MYSVKESTNSTSDDYNKITVGPISNPIFDDASS